MRTFESFLIICVVAICFCTSCSDKELLEDAGGCVTRTAVDGSGISTSNPDLIANWENVDRITLNTSGADRVSSPWNKNGTSSSLSESFLTDVKKEDGWKMLFHTFEAVGNDSKQNYMCLYNQFTGVVKIFYYHEGNTNSSGTQWFLMTSGGQHVKLLDEPAYFSKPETMSANNDRLLFSNAVKNPATGIEIGWTTLPMPLLLELV